MGLEDLAAALETHHLLNNGLALLGDLGALSRSIGAVLAELLGFSVDLHGHELVDLFVATLAGGHPFPPSERRERVASAGPRAAFFRGTLLGRTLSYEP